MMKEVGVFFVSSNSEAEVDTTLGGKCERRRVLVVAADTMGGSLILMVYLKLERIQRFYLRHRRTYYRHLS